jgi:hypothetical protein
MPALAVDGLAGLPGLPRRDDHIEHFAVSTTVRVPIVCKRHILNSLELC